MRQRLAVLVPLLGGCSFIYNPDHINRNIDAQVADVEIVTDVDPTMLQIDDVFPHLVYEGAGTGHAAPAVFVITGKQIAADATVTVAPDAADAATVHVIDSKAAVDGNFIAFTLQVDDDAAKNDGVERMVTLTVSQSGGTIMRSLDPAKLVVHHLESLTATTAAPLLARYSFVDITGPVAFAATNDVGPVQIHSIGSISITGKVSADASGQTAGPGGCSGGAAGASGESSNALTGCSCSGHGLAAAGGLLNDVGGGGAGFASPGTAGSGPGGGGGGPYGTREIDAFSNNCASGGGGGTKGTVTLGAPSAAGGGGGILELSAGGDVTLGAGATANGGSGLNSGGGNGGGGAGGVVLIRSGATLAITGTVSATKGGGGTGGATGGDGSIGRIRADAAKGTLPAGSYNAPVFVDPPATTTTQHTMLQVRGFAGDQTAQLTVYDAQGMVVGSPVAIAFGQSDTLMQQVSLKAGYNRVCAIVKNGNLSSNPEAGNCSEIAFLP
ncbi:MAG: hypothetical protein ABJE66_12420 [Deltaproteobacteria bacterium]